MEPDGFLAGWFLCGVGQTEKGPRSLSKYVPYLSHLRAVKTLRARRLPSPKPNRRRDPRQYVPDFRKATPILIHFPDLPKSGGNYGKVGAYHFS